MMMKIKDNFHTHIYLCKHATGNVEDYVKRAIELNYESIGISDHGPLTEYFLNKFVTRRMTIDEYKNIYLPEIINAKKKFFDKITVLGALEIEFYEELSTEYAKWHQELDYLILGQHNIELNDHNFKTIYQCTPGNKDELELYVKKVIDGLNSGFFDILAHPDIFMMFYQKWDNWAILGAKKIIETAIKNNVLLELNANGIRKGKITNLEGIETYKYPFIEFWRLVANYKDAKVIISDDAHKVSHLKDQATIEAYKIADELGLKIETKFIDYIKKKKS